MDQIFQSIQKFSRKSFQNVEIEAKFRELDRGDYLFLRDFLIQKYRKYTEKYIVDYYVKNDKRISEEKNLYTETSKKQLFNDFYRKIKFTVSEEKLIELDIGKPPSYKFKRTKNRLSFVSGNLQFDLTFVEENENYEFEIEVIDHKKYDITEFKESVVFFETLLSSYKGE
jgi:hypothetical protein